VSPQPSNSYVEALISNVMDDISKWDIWEVIRFKWEQEGGVISGLLE
jgi:hypothetical protein